MDRKRTLTIGLAQVAPVWLDREATIGKVVDYVEKAAHEGCRLVAFGECLVPGYPFWLEHTDGARFDSALQKELFAAYVEQAVDIERGDLEAVQAAARRHQIEVVLGAYERTNDRGHSGYCSVVTVAPDGEVINAHRKIMPTYEERLVWAIGDGHGLRVHDLAPFRVGTLNCWENWLPLLRATLHAQGEDLHVAVWPGSLRNTEEITRFAALEGRSYVASVSGLLSKKDLDSRESLPQAELLLRALPDVMADGGSCVAAPDGSWLVPPCEEGEQLLVAELDRRHVLMERQNLDPSGHYSRPDVVRLDVDFARQAILNKRPD